MSSTFTCPVVEVQLLPHKNADTLSLVKIGGYQCVVKSNEWQNGQLAVYVPPDSVVPDRPEWGFLNGKRRITARRFRQEWSHGLLIPCPSGLSCGDNGASVLGIIPYESPSARREGLSARQYRALPLWRRLWNYGRELCERPRGEYPYYDIENFRRYTELFTTGEPVIVTEKIHGANALYTSTRPWYGGLLWLFTGKDYIKIHMRSRTVWKHPLKRDWWQDAYRNTPGLEHLLIRNPGWTVYGEVYGKGVQQLEYGVATPHFAAFDIWTGKTWLRQDLAQDVCEYHHVPFVPEVYYGPYPGYEKMLEMLEGLKTSPLATRHNQPKQILEGLVIQSCDSRKILKLLSNVYLEKGVA